MKNNTVKKLLATKVETMTLLDNKAEYLWLTTTKLINIILESYLGINNDLNRFREEIINFDTFYNKTILNSPEEE